MATHTRINQLSEVLEFKADQLNTAVKEQKQLIIALKSFLEDKTSRLETALESENETVKESEYQSSWPSSTLSTAYFAALLLSSVLSSVAATSIVTRKQYSRTGRPTFVPSDYSLPGLGTLNKIQIQPSMKRHVEISEISESTKDTIVATQDNEVPSTTKTVTTLQNKAEAKVSPAMKLSDDWVEDFSRTQTAIRQPGERKSTPGRLGQVGGFSSFPGGRGRFSLLEDRDGDIPQHNTLEDGGSNHGTGGFYGDPGPVIPSTGNGGSSWSTPSGGGGSGGGGHDHSSPSGSGGDGGGDNDDSDDDSVLCCRV